MRQASIEKLLARALALPRAVPTDFFSENAYPTDVDPDRLRTIKDHVLRSRLIKTGYAVGVQSPRGIRGGTSIILLHLAGDAPPREVKPRLARRKKSTQDLPGLARISRRGPTIEEMEQLCQRVRSEEQSLAAHVVSHADKRMQELQQALGAAPPHSQEFTRLYHELGTVLEGRRNHTGVVREEAFKRIQGDQGFALRPYLALLSTAA